MTFKERTFNGHWTILTIKWTLPNQTFLVALVILHAYEFLSHFLFKNMSHCLTLTPNPLLFTYLIVNFTPSVFSLAFGL